MMKSKYVILTLIYLGTIVKCKLKASSITVGHATPLCAFISVGGNISTSRWIKPRSWVEPYTATIGTKSTKCDRTVEKWMDQPLDHFDQNEKRIYKMRYFENLELWQPNGPIYIFIGGEGEQFPAFIESDDRVLMGQIAKETNGALFATEHRYYGRSLPDIPNDDLIKYYKFLSSQQALADVANLIKILKRDPEYVSSKVVVIGGSYSGNLAAWMRVVYPDLVDAAIAMSAPVLAKTDFHEYLDVVGNTFGKYGTKDCLSHFEKKYKRYEELLKSAEGIDTLKNETNICQDSDLTVLENKQLFFAIQYYMLKLTAQIGTPSSVKNVCADFDGIGSTFKRDYINLLNHNISTLSRYDNCVPINFTAPLWTDAWSYQTCTEFGYKQSTSSEIQPFVHWNPVEFWLKAECAGFIYEDIEKKVDEAVAKTNKMYGGLTPKVTKVVFTHGDMDPWHKLGVLHDLSPDAPAFVVEGSSHCGILFVTQEEPPKMEEIRKKVKELIKKWISTS